ncbi:MAG: dihydropteroate synthase [Thermoleophilia bacterium]
MSREATAGTAWEHARGVIDCARGRLVGIVNANPDSFSDGGVSAGTGRAVAHGRALAEAGADVVEVGGESLRFSDHTPVEVEIGRVVPVIERLRAELDVPVAVDTFKAPVAEAAIAAGAAIVNDPTGLRDPEMARVVAAGGAGLVLTHFFGPPKVRPASFPDVDVPSAVAAWARARLAHAGEAGIPAGRIVIDPGVGLGKSPEQDLDLLHRIDEVVALGRPVLVPISNKKVLGALTGRAAPDRLAGTAAGLVWCRLRGAALFRVHDVAFMRDALRVTEALMEGRAERWFEVSK